MSDELQHIMNLHNGELGVTWEDPDAVTSGTIAKVQALITEANKAGYRKGYEHCLVGKAPTQQLKENK